VNYYIGDVEHRTGWVEIHQQQSSDPVHFRRQKQGKARSTLDAGVGCCSAPTRTAKTGRTARCSSTSRRSVGPQDGTRAS